MNKAKQVRIIGNKKTECGSTVRFFTGRWETATPENIAILRHRIKLFDMNAVNGERHKLVYSRPPTDKQRLAMTYGYALRQVKGVASCCEYAVARLHNEAYKLHATALIHGYLTLAEDRVREASTLLEEAEEFIRKAKEETFK